MMIVFDSCVQCQCKHVLLLMDAHNPHFYAAAASNLRQITQLPGLHSVRPPASSIRNCVLMWMSCSYHDCSSSIPNAYGCARLETVAALQVGLVLKASEKCNNAWLEPFLNATVRGLLMSAKNIEGS